MLATMLASLHSWCETFRVSSRWTHLDSVDRSRQLLRTHVAKLSSQNLHDLFLLLGPKDTNLGSFCQCCCAASEVAPACSSSRVPHRKTSVSSVVPQNYRPPETDVRFLLKLHRPVYLRPRLFLSDLKVITTPSNNFVSVGKAKICLLRVF